MAPPRFRTLIPLLAAAAAAGCASDPNSAPADLPPSRSPDPVTAPASPPAEPWLVTEGTTTLGFGLLRVAAGRFRVRFEDRGDGGYASDGTSAAVFVLPAEAFAAGPGAHADRWLGFGRASRAPGSGPVVAEAEFAVPAETTVVVAYGPWDGADTGRPPSDRRTFTLAVEPLDGGNHRWVESEAGEIVTTNWTRRPGVARGGPARDPATGREIWIESRVLVLYDAKHSRDAAAAPATEEEAEGLPLPAEIHEVLRKVPIKWR
jgi:hypothetical protein